MNSIESLKTELIRQKSVIESMGGVVSIANQNPSPSEITEGIKTVTGTLDLTISTATEDDVAVGKTFFSGTTVLKTGKNQSNDYYDLYVLDECSAETLSTPDHITTLRDFKFAGVPGSNSSFIFNNNIEQVNSYAFYYATFKDFTFENDSSLKVIGHHSFYHANININLSHLPNTIEKVETHSFAYITAINDGYFKIPQNLTNPSSHSFNLIGSNEFPDGLYWNNCTNLSRIPASMLAYHSYHGELTFPSYIKFVDNCAFYNAKFDRLIFPTTIESYGSRFYSYDTSTAMSMPNMIFIFENPTPIFSYPPFGGFDYISEYEIYVPDSGYEEYVNCTHLSNFASHIKRMSELPE